jgi:hypothetical protein
VLRIGTVLPSSLYWPVMGTPAFPPGGISLDMWVLSFRCCVLLACVTLPAGSAPALARVSLSPPIALFRHPLGTERGWGPLGTPQIIKRTNTVPFDKTLG